MCYMTSIFNCSITYLLCLTLSIFQYLEYVMKVLLPEMLIKIHMDVHKITHTKSELMMKEALSRPGAVFQ
jgi:hypothetical protein